MATNKKISELPAVTDVLATDEFVLARSGTSNKIAGSDLVDEITAAVPLTVARTMEALVFGASEDVTVGDGALYLAIPALLDGFNLVAAQAHVITVSSSGLPTIQVHNVSQSADMLTTRITIDVGEKDSSSAATPPVIDTGNDDVATGDELRIDVDVAGTGTKGLIVMLTFEAP